jgi:hypothetical protein
VARNACAVKLAAAALAEHEKNALHAAAFVSTAAAEGTHPQAKGCPCEPTHARCPCARAAHIHSHTLAPHGSIQQVTGNAVHVSYYTRTFNPRLLLTARLVLPPQRSGESASVSAPLTVAVSSSPA